VSELFPVYAGVSVEKNAYTRRCPFYKPFDPICRKEARLEPPPDTVCIAAQRNADSNVHCKCFEKAKHFKPSLTCNAGRSGALGWSCTSRYDLAMLDPPSCRATTADDCRLPRLGRMDLHTGMVCLLHPSALYPDRSSTERRD
jgi:hypothetical protein